MVVAIPVLATGTSGWRGIAGGGIRTATWIWRIAGGRGGGTGTVGNAEVTPVAVSASPWAPNKAVFTETAALRFYTTNITGVLTVSTVKDIGVSGTVAKSPNMVDPVGSASGRIRRVTGIGSGRAGTVGNTEILPIVRITITGPWTPIKFTLADGAALGLNFGDVAGVLTVGTVKDGRKGGTVGESPSVIGPTASPTAGGGIIRTRWIGRITGTYLITSMSVVIPILAIGTVIGRRIVAGWIRAGGIATGGVRGITRVGAAFHRDTRPLNGTAVAVGSDPMVITSRAGETGEQGADAAALQRDSGWRRIDCAHRLGFDKITRLNSR